MGLFILWLESLLPIRKSGSSFSIVDMLVVDIGLSLCTVCAPFPSNVSPKLESYSELSKSAAIIVNLYHEF